MGLETVVIKQVVNVAKNTAKIQDAISVIQEKVVNDGLKVVEASQINTNMLTFDIVALAKGEIEDTDSILTPESLCSAPPLTQVQKNAGQIAVDDLRSQLSVTINNIDALKQGLITVQQPLQTLEITAQNLDNIITTVKAAVKVIKLIPLPTSVPPGVGIPVNVLTILSDSLDTLDKLIGAAKGVTKAVPPLVNSVINMIAQTISLVNELIERIGPVLTLLSFVQAKIDLGDDCPLVDQSDINTVKANVSSALQDEINALGDSSIPAINTFNEDQLINQLQPNSDNPLIYKGFTLTIEYNPNNNFDFPQRRVKGLRYFSTGENATSLFYLSGINNVQTGPLSGPITLYNDPTDQGKYSFSSSAQILVEEIKYKIDQYLGGLREIANKFNIQNQVANDRQIGMLSRDQIDDFNQTNPLPDYLLNGQNIVRLNIGTLGGPETVSGSIQINKPGTKLEMSSFGGTMTSNYLDTLLTITPPVGVGLPNQAAQISKNTTVFAYNTAKEEYIFPATGSWGYLMKITAGEGGSAQTNFDLISP